MQISKDDLQILNKLQFELYILSYQIKKLGLKESKDEWVKKSLHYDNFITHLLESYGFSSDVYQIDNAGNITKRTDEYEENRPIE